jgi:hypothetical protein
MASGLSFSRLCAALNSTLGFSLSGDLRGGQSSVLLGASCNSYTLKETEQLRAVLRIRIRDPVPFLTPRSGMGTKSGSGSGMNNPDHISESLETIFLVKTLKFFDADPGSGLEKIRIRDKHTGSVTLTERKKEQLR